MVPLFDTHMHLDYFPDTHADVIKRAIENGVDGFITIGTSLEQAPLLQGYANLYDNLFYSVGQHPHEAEKLDLTNLTQRLIDLKNHPKMIAYGETGLDYYYNHSPKEAQVNSFRAHIEAAIHHDLPIIVHTREAERETIDILIDYQNKNLRGVIHCFSGTKEFAEFVTQKMGFFISFSGILTFPKALDIQNVARDIPLEYMLIETDSPYLAPIPHRGKQNEPMWVRNVFDKICALRETVQPDVLGAQLRKNVQVLFGV